MTHYVGLDVSQKLTSICIVDATEDSYCFRRTQPEGFTQTAIRPHHGEWP
jgi:hypothetical protein